MQFASLLIFLLFHLLEVIVIALFPSKQVVLSVLDDSGVKVFVADPQLLLVSKALS